MTLDNAQQPVQAAPAATARHGAPLEFTGPAALAPATSLRGAETLAATIAASPLLGLWFGLLDTKQRAGALMQIADFGADLFETMMKAAYDALGFTRAGPAERLHFYETQKTSDMWLEQQAKYPKDYEQDWNDWKKLQLLAAEGRLAEST